MRECFRTMWTHFAAIRFLLVERGYLGRTAQATNCKTASWKVSYVASLYAASLFIVCFACLSVATVEAQSVVMRDLTLLPERNVVGFNQESVELDDGSMLTWDQVLQADAGERQEEFDRNVREIGLPLFRLKKRIEIEDWNRVAALADQLLVRYSGVDSPSAKLVCLAAVRGLLETNQREASVFPFLLACSKSSELSPEILKQLGMHAEDLELGVAAAVCPVWFDQQAVAEQYQRIADYLADESGELPREANGGYVYMASFCIASGDLNKALEYLQKVDATDERLQQWKLLLESEVDRISRRDKRAINLFRADESTSSGPSATCSFLDARSEDSLLRDSEPARVILGYLKVTAIWGEQFPDLASASLYEAIEVARDSNLTREAETLSAELLRRYPNSYHGRLLATEN